MKNEWNVGLWSRSKGTNWVSIWETAFFNIKNLVWCRHLSLNARIRVLKCTSYFVLYAVETWPRKVAHSLNCLPNKWKRFKMEWRRVTVNKILNANVYIIGKNIGKSWPGRKHCWLILLWNIRRHAIFRQAKKVSWSSYNHR